MVPSDEKPASSARRAQSTIPRRSTPLTVLGSPIPTSMVSSFYGAGTVAAHTLDELPGWARELLDGAPVARLGLIDDDGGPRVMPVTFARVGGALWSAVDDKPKRRPGAELARVRWLRERPRAALTVDRYDDDWARLAWVQVLGAVTVLEAEGEDAALDALAARYPQYRERRPGGPLLRLEPERVLCWRAAGD
jgi:PPOX class probable F420-dependent enzyme